MKIAELELAFAISYYNQKVRELELAAKEVERLTNQVRNYPSVVMGAQTPPVVMGFPTRSRPE